MSAGEPRPRDPGEVRAAALRATVEDETAAGEHARTWYGICRDPFSRHLVTFDEQRSGRAARDYQPL